jgi:hypothetical protein
MSDWKPTLKKVENMDEAHLCNTISCESRHIGLDRRNECKMELMKRWTKELSVQGFVPKIITPEPEIIVSRYEKKRKSTFFENSDKLMDQIFSR